MLRNSEYWENQGEFKVAYDKKFFCDFLEPLKNEKLLKGIYKPNEKSTISDGMEIRLDYKKVSKIINKLEGNEIIKEMFDGFKTLDAIVVYNMLLSEGAPSKKEIKIRDSLYASYYFVFTFFFNARSPRLYNNICTFRVDDAMKEILKSLAEIENVKNEVFDIYLTISESNDKLIVELGEPTSGMFRITKEMGMQAGKTK